MLKITHKMSFYLLIIFAMQFITISKVSAENMVSTEFEIKLNHLKLKAPTRFLKHDKPVDKQYIPLGWWEVYRYKKALRLFPTVKQCLTTDGVDEKILDLTKFDWSKLDSFQKAEVCLYCVADILETPERAAAWFKNQGFDKYLKVYPENHSQFGGARFIASWPFRTHGTASPFENFTFRWLGELGVSGGVGIVVEYNKKMEVKLIDIKYTFK